MENSGNTRSLSATANGLYGNGETEHTIVQSTTPVDDRLGNDMGIGVGSANQTQNNNSSRSNNKPHYMDGVEIRVVNGVEYKVDPRIKFAEIIANPPPEPTQPPSLSLGLSKTGPGCTCKKSKCLKLYCQCFAQSALCVPDKCKCSNCNNFDDVKNVKEIKKSRSIVLYRNPRAFEYKFKTDNDMASELNSHQGYHRNNNNNERFGHQSNSFSHMSNGM